MDSTATPINQGDALYLNPGGGLVALASSANSANFAGIATESPSPTASPKIKFYRKGLFLLKRSGGGFTAGASVYMLASGGDAQTVSTTSSGTAIGIVHPDQSGNTADSASSFSPQYVVVAITPAV